MAHIIARMLAVWMCTTSPRGPHGSSSPFPLPSRLPLSRSQ